MENKDADFLCRAERLDRLNLALGLVAIDMTDAELEQACTEAGVPWAAFAAYAAVPDDAMLDAMQSFVDEQRRLADARDLAAGRADEFIAGYVQRGAATAVPAPEADALHADADAAIGRLRS